MTNANPQNWNNELIENCIIQCLYSQFEKYVQVIFFVIIVLFHGHIIQYDI